MMVYQLKGQRRHAKIPPMKKIIFFLTTLLLLGILFYFYINRFLIPLQLKDYLVTQVQNSLQRPIAIEQIRFEPLQGFLIDNVIVGSKDTSAASAGESLLTIKHIRVRIGLLPLIRKQIFIHSLTLVEPAITLVYHGNNQWNVSDILPLGTSDAPAQNQSSLVEPPSDHKPQKPTHRSQKKADKFQVVISNILIQNATIHYLDDSHQPAAGEPAAGSATREKSFSNIDFLGSLSLNKIFSFLVTLLDAQKQSQLKIAGRVDFPKQTLVAKILAHELLLSDYAALIPSDVPFHVESGAFSTPEINIYHDKNQINVDGNFVLEKTKLQLNDKTTFAGSMRATIHSLSYSNNSLDLKSAFSIDDAQFASGDDLSFFSPHALATEFSLNLKNEKLEINTDLKLSQTHLNLGKEKSFQGDLNIPRIKLISAKNFLHLDISSDAHEGKLTFNNLTLEDSPHLALSLTSSPLEETSIEYSGSIDFSNALLAGVPNLGQIENLKGTLLVQPNFLTTHSLSFTTHQTPFVLTGDVSYFDNPLLKLTLSSDHLDYANLWPLLPLETQKKIPVDLKGYAAVQASYEGFLYAPQDAKLSVTARLNDTTLSHEPSKTNVSDITGDIIYQNDLLRWKNLRGTYLGQVLTLNGKFEDFSRPVIEASLNSARLNLSTEIKLLHSAFKIVSLKGNYFQSLFDITGDVHLPEGTGPYLDLNLLGDLQLENLKDIFPSLKESLDPWQPTGTISIDGLFRGNLNQWRDWQLVLKAQSPEISLAGYSFKNLLLEMNQRDRYVNKFNLNGQSYGGNLSMNATADLDGDDLPFKTSFQLENSDLSQLREKFKNDWLEGHLSLQSKLHGSLTDLNQWIGSGSFTIKDGLLGKLIPQLEQAYFTSAQGDFAVKHKKISTRNTYLYSQTIDLKTKGSIDFNGNLDFDIVPDYDKLKFGSSTETTITPATLLKEILRIKVTGTLDKPHYAVQTSPLKILEKTADVFKGGLKEGVKGVESIWEIFQK